MPDGRRRWGEVESVATVALHNIEDDRKRQTVELHDCYIRRSLVDPASDGRDGFIGQFLSRRHLERAVLPEPRRGDLIAVPATGGYTYPTMSCEIQLFNSKESTKAHRHTSTSLYHCFKGQGRTKVGEGYLEWKKGDSFWPGCI